MARIEFSFKDKDLGEVKWESRVDLDFKLDALLNKRKNNIN